MRRPNLIARVEVKCVAGNVTLDVGKQIFIRRDAESGRSILPFDFECAARVDIGKSADRAVIGFDIAVASNSDPPATGDQNERCGND